jgi:pimeloyl-ACP methyl ester carboxylesterase
MPYLDVHDTRLWYEDTGPGSTGETVVMSHGLLMSTELFRPQIEHLRARYRVVAWDHRGQGRSADDERRSIGMELVTDDALALLDALELDRVHFVGLSMGGFVGMRIAARRPERVRSLVLLDTSAGPEPRENLPKYTVLNAVARHLGFALVADRVMPILFGRTTMTDPAKAALRSEWRVRLAGNRKSIWRAVNGVLEREGVEHLLPAISAPTLIVVGEEDVATVPARSEHLHARIRGSRLVRIPHAGHSATIEQPSAVNAALDAFYEHLA